MIGGRTNTPAPSHMNYYIGDVLVHIGEPQDANPYKDYSLIGDERHLALLAFRDGKDTHKYTFWYGPCHGGAKRIQSPEEINWEHLREIK